jgi:histidine triad (HIT) family protein
MSHECIFCNIIEGKAPAEFLYKDDKLVVFKDLYPHAPVHLLIVPRKHIRSVNELTEKETALLAHMILVGKSMAKDQGIASTGYKLLYNVERGGGQVIFHLHLHLLGGWK